MGRAAALLALLAALVAYYAAAERLPGLPIWADEVFLSLGLIPAVFALAWLARPLRHAARPAALGLAAVGLAVVTLVFALLGWEIAANFAKFAAVVAAGWWFLTFFESVAWVLLVAVLIVPVDIFSVARGPTRHIVEEQPAVFDALSIAFPLPGEAASAQLGLPDVLFFALFLGAAERFGLRPRATWIAMALSFGGTLVLAVSLGVGGLPALPLLSLAFVAVNADLLWRRWRGPRPDDDEPPP